MRQGKITRNTSETQIEVIIGLDPAPETGPRISVSTGYGMADHMLNLIAFWAGFDLTLTCKGDLHIDGHHTVEDIGIAFGQAFNQAIGDKKGLRRYGHAYVPLDEALSRVVVDFSGRPGLIMPVQFTAGRIGALDTQLIHEFFQGFVNHAFITLHIDCLRGHNAHHQAETIFKACGRALRMALEYDPRALDQIPSTKGSL